MSRRCPECGGLLGAGDATCRACGYAVGPAAARGPRRTEVASGGPAPDIEFGDAGTPPPRSRPTAAEPLGDMPSEGDADAFDLSAILDGVGSSLGGGGGMDAPRTKGGFVPAFTFPGTEVASGPASSAPPPEAGASVPESPADKPSGDGWRVRNANGTTYDMVSIESVVQWLQNKDSFDGIRISRGGGPMRTVEDHPELVARLGMKPAGASFASEDAAPRLDLDLAGRRPAGSRAPAAARPPSRAPQKPSPAVSGPAPAGASPRPAARTPAPGRTFGMGFSLVLVAVGLLCTFAGVVALGQLDLAAAPAEPEAVTVATAEPPPGPGLAAALAAFEAQRYTAAEQLLLQAARTEQGDPRIHRYLALTLFKLGGRDAEARAALAEFRRARLRAGGE
jgi:hypothetical protein